MKRKIVILAEKRLGPTTSKMTNGAIRYLPDEVVAVIDSRYSGKTVQLVLGFGGSIPVVSSLEEALKFHPTSMLIGISPAGGEFPPEWYPVVIQALQNKLNIISGLHYFIGDVPEFKVLAEKYKVKIHDLRRNNQPEILARGLARNFKSKIILTVGTHGNIGKMTTTIEIVKYLQRAGISVDWLATGQIGILIKGKGTPLDAIKGDFLSGAVEAALIPMDGNSEYIFVEGQGSLQHLGYSSVALGLLHGSLPDAMILCHRTDLGISDYGVDTTDFRCAVDLNEKVLSFVKPSKVIAVSLNTYNLSEDRATKYIEAVQNSVELPVTDPVRFGAKILADAVLNYFGK